MKLLGNITKRKQQEVMWFYIFLLPGLIGFSLLAIYPFFRALYLSFTDRTLLGFDPMTFVWFKNYQRAFHDPYVWESLKLSLIYALFTTVGVNLMALLSAMLLTVKNKFIKVYRTIFYIPSILPAVSSVLMFSWIFNPAQGVINTILHAMGVENTPMWLEHTKTVLPTMILMSLWSFGGKMVIYLAGLQGISQDYYEAASIEGANRRNMFRYITFPQLTPVIFYNVLMSIIGGIQVFTEAYVLSGTGAGVPVNFYLVNIYTHAYNGAFQLGYASALAWILFVVILVISRIYFYINNRYFNYDVV